MIQDLIHVANMAAWWQWLTSIAAGLVTFGAALDGASFVDATMGVGCAIMGALVGAGVLFLTHLLRGLLRQ